MIITNKEQLIPFKKKQGVYLFTDKLDNTKSYGGKGNSIYNRIVYTHHPKEPEQWIDRIIKKYGLFERFIVELIHWWDEPVDNLEVLALETAVIDTYNCLKEKGGYNILLFNFDRTGTKNSEEHKKKNSEASKGIKNHFYGKHHTDEAKNKIKFSKLGKKQSKEICLKKSLMFKGENNPRFGIKLSEGQKEKCKKTWELKLKNGYISPINKKIKQIDIKTGKLIKIWDSIGEAANAMGLKNRSPISMNLKGKYKHSCGFKWEYL